MKHRIAPLAILLLASFLYDALGLFLAIGAMVLVPSLANGPLESLVISQAMPSESALLPPPFSLDLNPERDPGSAGPVAPVLALVPDLSPPFSMPALTGDVVRATNTTRACHGMPPLDQPTAAYQVATGLERIIAHGTSELTGLDGIMASVLPLDHSGVTYALHGPATPLAGILPEVVVPPG